MILEPYCVIPVLASVKDTKERQRLQELLKAYLDEQSALGLILGDDANAALAAATLSGMARQFPGSRVLWLKDPRALTDEQRARWRPQATTLVTFLTVERHVSSHLTMPAASKASDLTLALLAALAGKTS